MTSLRLFVMMLGSVNLEPKFLSLLEFEFGLYWSVQSSWAAWAITIPKPTRCPFHLMLDSIKRRGKFLKLLKLCLFEGKKRKFKRYIYIYIGKENFKNFLLFSCPLKSWEKENWDLFGNCFRKQFFKKKVF